MLNGSRQRILITGGAGFIGFHLASELAREPSCLVVLADNFSRGKRDDELERLTQRPNVRVVSADLTDPQAFAALGTGYDEVYHLAAILGVQNVLNRPHEVLRVNDLSTLFLLDWFVKGGGERLLFSSTSEVYAWTQRFYPLPIPTPEDVPVAITDPKNPRSSYAASKIVGEIAVAQYCGVFNKPYAIVRYHNVYGPRMGTAHVIPELYLRALGGESPLLVSSAGHRRAFCYVSDAVAATVAAMRTPAAAGATINVGNDREEVSIGELAERLLAVASLRVPVVPQGANDPIPRRCPDITRARELLGYQPRVALVEGLGRTVEWYSRHAGAELQLR